jgi:sugar O-acyltransferase (sialic acid O-acetyltransferase NeuD family)
MKKRQIAVYGAGGFGREVAWLASCCLHAGRKMDPVCFIDDDEKIQGRVLNSLPVMSLAAARDTFPDATIVSGIGIPRIREATMAKAAAAGFDFATLVHPRTEMSAWVEIGRGTVICTGNIITTNVIIREQVQINLGCTVGHDVVMDDYATLAPGVHISGCVHVGKRAYLGTGAVIINGTQNDHLVIGDDAIIGAGACVTRSVPAGATWGGVPAGPLHRNPEGASPDVLRERLHQEVR